MITRQSEFVPVTESRSKRLMTSLRAPLALLVLASMILASPMLGLAQKSKRANPNPGSNDPARRRSSRISQPREASLYRR